MGDYEGKARDAVRKADKKLTGFSIFGGSKYDDAAALYEKAANNFKLAKLWRDAGETYGKLAQVQVKMDSKYEAAAAYVEAAKAYNKVSPPDAVRYLHKAVEFYTEVGRLGMAAKNLRDVAENLEKQGQKVECVEFYNQAAELFSSEDSTSEATKCRLKVAQFSAELERYPTAIQIYEDAAAKAVENPLLKYSAKGYLLNAGICHLCVGDEVAVKNAIDKYEDLDMAFSGSRECNLLKTLSEAVEGGDVDRFTEALGEYDAMTRLDPWKTQLLLRVKTRMTTAVDADEEDLT